MTETFLSMLIPKLEKIIFNSLKGLSDFQQNFKMLTTIFSTIICKSIKC